MKNAVGSEKDDYKGTILRDVALNLDYGLE
jgi:hypothetical protein